MKNVSLVGFDNADSVEFAATSKQLADEIAKKEDMWVYACTVPLCETMLDYTAAVEMKERASYLSMLGAHGIKLLSVALTDEEKGQYF